LFFPDFRFSSRLLRLALMAALAAGMTPGLTARAAAQIPGPALALLEGQAPGAKPGAAPAHAPREQNNSEEAQINGFLHAPAVKGLARFLHLSLETTDDLFLALNYLIIFLAIAIPLTRFMPKVIRKRNITLRHNLDAARKLTEEATARLNVVEAQLAKLGDEIGKFRSEVEAEMKNDETRIKAAIEQESAHIVAAAEQEIGLAAVQARRGLRKFAAELAVEQAATRMALTPETDRALVAEFAESLAGHKNGSAGGQD
jgi:F-type H+-transporting ATPase subunit b